LSERPAFLFECFRFMMFIRSDDMSCVAPTRLLFAHCACGCICGHTVSTIRGFGCLLGLRRAVSSRVASRCRIQKCRRPPSVSLGGLQRRLAKRAELPPIFHLQSRFRAAAAIASKNGMDDVRRS